VRRLAYQYFGEVPKPSGTDLTKNSGMDGTLCTFLMSSFNIELVHILLTSVSEHTVGRSKVTGERVKSKKAYSDFQAYDFLSYHHLDLPSIQIQNKTDWEVDHVVMDAYVTKDVTRKPSV
jgi:hypothetical protein